MNEAASPPQGIEQSLFIISTAANQPKHIGYGVLVHMERQDELSQACLLIATPKHVLSDAMAGTLAGQAKPNLPLQVASVKQGWLRNLTVTAIHFPVRAQMDVVIIECFAQKNDLTRHFCCFPHINARPKASAHFLCVDATKYRMIRRNFKFETLNGVEGESDSFFEPAYDSLGDSVTTLTKGHSGLPVFCENGTHLCGIYLGRQEREEPKTSESEAVLLAAYIDEIAHDFPRMRSQADSKGCHRKAGDSDAPSHAAHDILIAQKRKSIEILKNAYIHTDTLPSPYSDDDALCINSLAVIAELTSLLGTTSYNYILDLTELRSLRMQLSMLKNSNKRFSQLHEEWTFYFTRLQSMRFQTGKARAHLKRHIGLLNQTPAATKGQFESLTIISTNELETAISDISDLLADIVQKAGSDVPEKFANITTSRGSVASAAHDAWTFVLGKNNIASMNLQSKV